MVEIAKELNRRCSDQCPYESQLVQLTKDVAELKEIMLMVKGSVAAIKALVMAGSGLVTLWAAIYTSGATI